MKSKALCVALSLSIVGSLTMLSAIPAESRTQFPSPPTKKLKGKIERDVMMADDLMMKGKYSDAADLYRQAVQHNPKNVPAIVGLGMALSKQFKLDGADEQFDKALNLNGENAMAHVGKATVMLNRLQSSSMTYIKQKDSMLKQAEDQCKQAINIDPSMPEAHYTLGMIYKEQLRLDDAANELTEAGRCDPKYPDAFAGLGLVKLAQGSLAEAAGNFKRAISLNSSNSTAHYGLGRTYLKQGMIDDAIKELNTSLYQFPNSAPTHETLGEAYDAQGNTVAAIKEFQSAIGIKPEFSDCYMHIADIRDQRGDVELAIAELRSGIELMPNNADLHMRVADLSLRDDKLDDAIKEYTKVMQMDPKNSDAAKGLTRGYYLKSAKEAGGAFFGSNEFEQADNMINQAIALNPNDMELRLAEAKLRAMSGKPVDLQSLGTPRTDGERVAYAEALLAQNKFKEAQDQMNIVLANANTPKQIFAVGDLALMIKDYDSAEAAYRKGTTFAGSEDRAKRGLANVAKAKDQARQDLTLADDLSRKKQLASAIDKYHAAVYENPRVADARMGLGKALEKVSQATPAELREAVVQYRAYMSLTPDMPEKERQKLEKHMDSLEEKAYKIEQKAKQSKRGY